MSKQLLLAVVSAMLLMSPAGASTENVSEKAVPEAGTSILDKIYVNYFAFYHAGPLSDPTSARLYDIKGNPKTSGVNGMNFDSTLVAAYKITKDIGVGPELNFIYEPVMGHAFTLNDSGLRIFDNHLLHFGTFNLYANLIIQAPVSQYSQQRGTDVGIKTTPILSYGVPHTPVTVGAYTEIKSYYGSKFGKDFKLYAEPYAYYRLSDTFDLSLMYEAETDHMPNKPKFDFTTAPGLTDLEPGFKARITRKIWVNPYLMIYTGEKMTWQNTSLNATLSVDL